MLYSGNLGRKQGLDQVVAMAEQLATRRPEIEIMLRGNGNQAQELAAEIARRQLDNVRFCRAAAQRRTWPPRLPPATSTWCRRTRSRRLCGAIEIFNIMAVGRPFVATALPDSTLWQPAEAQRRLPVRAARRTASFADAVLRSPTIAALRRSSAVAAASSSSRTTPSRVILDDFMSRLDAISADA